MLNDLFDQDKVGDVYNSERNYVALADILENNGSVVIGWTDQDGSHLDILFCVSPIQVGDLQGGMSTFSDLFVAVAFNGMFGFTIQDNYLASDYVAKKLNLGPPNSTSEKLAVLIGEVRKRLV
jgi:hypothetical protein